MDVRKAYDFLDCATTDSKSRESSPPKVSHACGPHEYQCLNKPNLCIPTTWVCDGYDDCPEADDETKCAGEKVTFYATIVLLIPRPQFRPLKCPTNCQLSQQRTRRCIPRTTKRKYTAARARRENAARRRGVVIAYSTARMVMMKRTARQPLQVVSFV